MEFDTPSRFISDIDPSLLNVQNPMAEFSTPRFERRLQSDEQPSARYYGGRDTAGTYEKRSANPRLWPTQYPTLHVLENPRRP